MPQYAPVLELSGLNGANGFQINGEATDDRSGRSVSSAGDVNGDGFDDLIVGTSGSGANGVGSGASYVVFGKASGFGATLELSSLNGANGFQINGEAAYDFSGRSVASAGDVNGDGFADLIVGAAGADPNGGASGASYVVFGKASGFGATLELSSLNGANGFQINGEAADDQIGFSVSSAGDVNGDGFDDLIIGAPYAAPNGFESGTSYVVFGKASGFAATLQLSSLNGANGFQINGEATFDNSGFSVDSAGDINGDGFADLIVGAYGADPNGFASYGAGASYVVFGKASGFGATLELASLNGANGFRVDGEVANDESGVSVSSAGDVNADGFGDLIVGARYADPNGSASGASYVVFGKASGFGATLELPSLNGANGFQISGEAAYDQGGRSVSSAGDFNGDGFDDLIVGAYGAGPNGSFSGASYVVFGKASGFAANLQLSSLNGANGFQINGEAAYDYSGRSVSSAGDVNGDGFADLIVGARNADPNGANSGASYVIFGSMPGQAVTRTGTAIANIIHGGDFNDTLSGLGGADTLIGLAGADLLDGGTGADTMRGGGGNDIYVVDTIGDVTTESSVAGGLDRVQASVTRTLGANLENLTLTGAGVINGAGNALNNVLIGNGAANTLSGLASADRLIGGAGGDRLIGGLGLDTLTGNSGADKFIFNSAPAAADRDTITDYNVAADTIQLENAVFAGIGAAGVLAAPAFHIGAAAAAADDRIIYDSANGKLYFDADGNGAGAQIQFATLSSGLLLTAADFVVI